MTKLEELAEKHCIQRCKIGGELHDVTFTPEGLRAFAEAVVDAVKGEVVGGRSDESGYKRYHHIDMERLK